MEYQITFGIVERVENGKVYTIEGNSNDSCAERNYDINSSVWNTNVLKELKNNEI